MAANLHSPTLDVLSNYLDTHLSPCVAKNIAVGRVQDAISKCGGTSVLNGIYKGSVQQRNAMQEAERAIKRACGSLPRSQDLALSTAMGTVRAGMTEATSTVNKLHQSQSAFSKKLTHMHEQQRAVTQTSLDAVETLSANVKKIEAHAADGMHGIIDRIENLEVLSGDRDSSPAKEHTQSIAERLKTLEACMQKTSQCNTQSLEMTKAILEDHTHRLESLSKSQSTDTPAASKPRKTKKSKAKPATLQSDADHRPVSDKPHPQQNPDKNTESGIDDSCEEITSAIRVIDGTDDNELCILKDSISQGLDQLRDIRRAHNENTELRPQLSRIEKKVAEAVDFVRSDRKGEREYNASLLTKVQQALHSAGEAVREHSVQTIVDDDEDFYSEAFYADVLESYDMSDADTTECENTY